MNIELLKKLEDVKLTESKMSTLYHEAFQLTRNLQIENTISCFSSFFKTRGFEITHNAKMTEAFYGNLKFILYHDGRSFHFNFDYGFELECQTFNPQRFLIGITQKKSNKEIYRSNSQQMSEDDYLQHAIETTERNIKRLHQQLETIDTTTWQFFIKNATDKEYPENGYNSMEELLNELFK